MNKWLDGDGLEKDIVISSRVRLARNIEDNTLPEQMNSQAGKKVVEMVKKSLNDDFVLYNIEDLSDRERNIFVENHLISPDLLKKPQISSFLLRDVFCSVS